MKLISIFCASALLCISFSMHAQVINTSMKPVANVDYNRLRRVDSVINSYVHKDQINGVVTLVIKDNQLVQWKGYGYLDKDSKKPIPRDAMFRIMSQTKAVTSVGIMILYEEGKLYLDEPISDFIPEFKNQRVLDKFNPADSSYTTVPAKTEYHFSRPVNPQLRP